MYTAEDSLRRKVIDKALVKMLVIDLQPGALLKIQDSKSLLK